MSLAYNRVVLWHIMTNSSLIWPQKTLAFWLLQVRAQRVGPVHVSQEHDDGEPWLNDTIMIPYSMIHHVYTYYIYLSYLILSYLILSIYLSISISISIYPSIYVYVIFIYDQLFPQHAASVPSLHWLQGSHHDSSAIQLRWLRHGLAGQFPQALRMKGKAIENPWEKREFPVDFPTGWSSLDFLIRCPVGSSRLAHLLKKRFVASCSHSHRGRITALADCLWWTAVARRTCEEEWSTLMFFCDYQGSKSFSAQSSSWAEKSEITCCSKW